MQLFKAAAILLAPAAAAAAAATGDHYAVLVAGSHTYGNYRHHADVAHAYHVAVAGGIPKDNIIVVRVCVLRPAGVLCCVSLCCWTPRCATRSHTPPHPTPPHPR